MQKPEQMVQTTQTQKLTQDELIKMVKERVSEFGRLLFLTQTGSKLYGTDTPTSDDDYVGVFLAKPEYYLGFKEVREIDASIKDKDESGKNTENAVDIKIYELKTFLKLAADSNPNIVELLFTKGIFNSAEFTFFQSNWDWFINERARHSFTGYARQQMKKGVMKAQNFSNLKRLKEVLEKEDPNEVLAVVVNKYSFLKGWDKGKTIQINNLTFQKNLFVKKVLSQINEKLETSSHRQKIWEEHGYDTKFFMHLFRLIDEGKTLLKGKPLVFPLKKRRFLIDICKGFYALEDLQAMAEDEFKEIENMKSVLPKKAKWNKIENYLIEIVKNEILKKEAKKLILKGE